ncbi:MAG: aminopeptidase P family protein [Rickettsiales bacterium]|nr:aminopeptidase P family protein [Rickettsiales bacterium]
MNTQQKLQALRERMKAQSLAGYIQPVQDEYMNEYPPECNRRVEWLTGFAGSAGTSVILSDKAAMFVDGRYTLQVTQEVDGTLFSMHNSAELSPLLWITQQLEQLRIGYDPQLYGRDAVAQMQKILATKQIELVPVTNLVDAMWDKRPQPPASQVEVHDESYSGEAHASKRMRVAVVLKEYGADAAIISAPDSVCWLLNVRGGDVEGSPLLLSIAIAHADGHVEWGMDAARCSDVVRAHLGAEVQLFAPADRTARLKALKGKRVLCDMQTLPVWYIQQLSDAGAVIVEGRDPCVPMKAKKNDIELQGIRHAHRRDGVALTRLLVWLDGQAPGSVTELQVSDQLLSYRSENNHFRGVSFNTIAGSGEHGAIVHYRASEASNRVLQPGELFLLDSGGQYPDGTTDITRTIPIGAPTAEHKDRFTRVLKGHIAIATARFPAGTTGSQLDVLARKALWDAGLDYDHGTGHGVGHFLNVHEGPQRISKRGGDAALAAGMIISNEPGYYKAGEYGIRIENLVAVRLEEKGWHGFETLSCVPIDTRVVEPALLTADEKKWLNGYHAWVLESLQDQLSEAERKWLVLRCAAI